MHPRRRIPNSPDAAIEEDIYSMLPHLRDLAWCAIQAQKMSGQEVIIFCIELCNFWADFANSLANGTDHPNLKVVNTGNERYISGLGDTGLSLLATRVAPDITERLSQPPEEGMARLLVFYAQGVVTLDIEPAHTNAAC